jgi:hypothetical protein
MTGNFSLNHRQYYECNERLTCFRLANYLDVSSIIKQLRDGSTSAPAQWTRLMEAILRPYLGKFVVIFLDDMCVFSQTAEEHVKHLDMVYRILAKNSIFLRFGKCFFFTRRFKFLG